jgi:hypothetical protein
MNSFAVAAIGSTLLAGAARAADPPIVRTPIAEFVMDPAKVSSRIRVRAWRSKSI